MKRKQTNTTPGPNAIETEFRGYTKTCACIVCGNPGPSIVDHCLGATFKHLKTLCGHWFIIPLCYTCDKFKSTPAGNIPRFVDMAGLRMCELWKKHIDQSPFDPPWDVDNAIMDWGR